MALEQRGHDQPGDTEVEREWRPRILLISTICPLMGKQRPAGKLEFCENDTTCHVSVDQCRPRRETLKRCEALLHVSMRVTGSSGDTPFTKVRIL